MVPQTFPQKGGPGNGAGITRPISYMRRESHRPSLSRQYPHFHHPCTHTIRMSTGTGHDEDSTLRLPAARICSHTPHWSRERSVYTIRRPCTGVCYTLPSPPFFFEGMGAEAPIPWKGKKLFTTYPTTFSPSRAASPAGTTLFPPMYTSLLSVRTAAAAFSTTWKQDALSSTEVLLG
jgi:hypothetical protein